MNITFIKENGETKTTDKIKGVTIDMGMHHGARTFYVPGNRSIRELIEAGELVAIPDPGIGVVFKRTDNATALERLAALTIAEVQEIERKRNEAA